MCYCAFSKDCCAEEPSALLTTVIKRQPNNCLVMCYCTFSKESRASLLLSIHIVIVQIVYNFLVVYNNRLWRYLWKKENYNKILATFPVIMIANGIVVSKPTTLLTNNLQIFWTAPRGTKSSVPTSSTWSFICWTHRDNKRIRNHPGKNNREQRWEQKAKPKFTSW